MAVMLSSQLAVKQEIFGAIRGIPTLSHKAGEGGCQFHALVVKVRQGCCRYLNLENLVTPLRPKRCGQSWGINHTGGFHRHHRSWCQGGHSPLLLQNL